MQILVPPKLVRQGGFESAVSRLGRIERERGVCQHRCIVVTFCIPSEPIEMLRSHTDVCSVDNEPGFCSVLEMEASDELPVVVQELGRGNVQEEEDGAQHPVARPPVLK